MENHNSLPPVSVAEKTPSLSYSTQEKKSLSSAPLSHQGSSLKGDLLIFQKSLKKLVVVASILLALYSLYWASELFTQMLEFDSKIELVSVEKFERLSIDFEESRFEKEFQDLKNSHSEDSELLEKKLDSCKEEHNKILKTINQNFNEVYRVKNKGGNIAS